MLGLPDEIRACLFDLDGVLTSTTPLHRRAWKRTFDAFLRSREGEDFAEFTDRDYIAHVDGRPRYDGVRGFLASRAITLPEGEPDDPAEANSVHGLGNRKNDLLVQVIEAEGVTPYPGSVRYLEAVAAAGQAIAVVTSSANAAAVFEDALAGVAAGRAGGFGYVIGVDRAGQAEALRDYGADVVVGDLAELL